MNEFMNPVLVLTCNNIGLSQRCVDSLLKQDVGIDLMVWDNGSTDGTKEWLQGIGVTGYLFLATENLGVSTPWNQSLHSVFRNADHCLVVNNDTVFPPWFCSSLLSRLSDNCLFVTGTSVANMEQISFPEPEKPLVEAPDFSAFLITKKAFETVGDFDADMKVYASDNDFHVRAHRVGISLWNAGVAFYHERSSTIKNASPQDRRAMCLGADADRDVFFEKYGCYPWQPEKYAALFQ